MFFFFKQKTAYEISACLVGSEMCIRDSFNLVMEERKLEMGKIAEEKQIPYQALIAGAAITLPLVAGSLGLNAMCIYDLAPQSIPYIYNFFVKFSGIQLCFFSGVHWGIAINQHDMQPNFVNSSTDVKIQFVLASLPLFLGFYFTTNLTQLLEASPQYGIASLIGMCILHLNVLYLDYSAVTKKQAPYWLLKLKLPLSIASIFSLGAIIYIYQNYQEKLKQKKSVYEGYQVEENTWKPKSKRQPRSAPEAEK
eukprot:TRINITY_DN3144_c0_g1_i5.p1 TRINITY_DN3144_c0_g1~~TRINITY_DN3144_c0_g1_i5.p1  ORF type:complete len:252 (-),score=47.75 TRINITY_DN3144_c0_g1_i5:66-821(-)